MAAEQIIFKSKPLRIQKAAISPDFNSKTVIVRDHWDYVEMWLKKEKLTTALEFWNQAERFYKSCNQKDSLSAPLLLYYCFLNASKALLTVKNSNFKETHGTSGEWIPGDTNLKNEFITFQGSGILTSLCGYFGDSCNGEKYSMKDLLYNLPFIHRSFNLTFPSGYQEIFFPVSDVSFLKIKGSKESFISAKLANKYSTKSVISKIESLGYEFDPNPSNMGLVFRKKKRFNWYTRGREIADNIPKLKLYHKGIRKDFHYIFGDSTLWYFKNSNAKNAIQREPLTIIFALMHRLSELSRYEPKKLSQHLNLKQNWLITEFIQGSSIEFIDRIACEITGQNIMKPAIRSRS